MVEGLADQLIRAVLTGSSVVDVIQEAFNLLTAFKGRHAAWLTPTGDVHELPDRGDYWHHHWVRDNLDKIPHEHVARLPDGRADGVETKLNLKRAGWIEKNAPHRYTVVARHEAKAVASIREHIKVRHPGLKQFKLTVVGEEGAGVGEPKDVLVNPERRVHQSDVARVRAMQMPAGWDAYTSPPRRASRA